MGDDRFDADNMRAKSIEAARPEKKYEDGRIRLACEIKERLVDAIKKSADEGKRFVKVDFSNYKSNMASNITYDVYDTFEQTEQYRELEAYFRGRGFKIEYEKECFTIHTRSRGGDFYPMHDNYQDAVRIDIRISW